MRDKTVNTGTKHVVYDKTPVIRLGWWSVSAPAGTRRSGTSVVESVSLSGGELAVEWR